MACFSAFAALGSQASKFGPRVQATYALYVWALDILNPFTAGRVWEIPARTFSYLPAALKHLQQPEARYAMSRARARCWELEHAERKGRKNTLSRFLWGSGFRTQ